MPARPCAPPARRSCRVSCRMTGAPWRSRRSSAWAASARQRRRWPSWRRRCHRPARRRPGWRLPGCAVTWPRRPGTRPPHAAFQAGGRRAQGLRVPLALARLEISDARRLRAAGEKQAAVARLRSARQRLTSLGARPYIETCDRELAAAGAPAEPDTAPALPGLTPAEQAVARLVAAGRSNRQTAAELYVSVKTVEFHLGHIYGKLGIRSRKDLITRIGPPPPHRQETQGRN